MWSESFYGIFEDLVLLRGASALGLLTSVGAIEEDLDADEKANLRRLLDSIWQKGWLKNLELVSDSDALLI